MLPKITSNQMIAFKRIAKLQSWRCDGNFKILVTKINVNFNLCILETILSTSSFILWDGVKNYILFGV